MPQTESWVSISKKIEVIRKEKNISQKQLGEKCNMSQGNLSRSLSGDDVLLSTLLNICKALEIKLTDLL